MADEAIVRIILQDDGSASGGGTQPASPSPPPGPTSRPPPPNSSPPQPRGTAPPAPSPPPPSAGGAVSPFVTQLATAISKVVKPFDPMVAAQQQQLRDTQRAATQVARASIDPYYAAAQVQKAEAATERERRRAEAEQNRRDTAEVKWSRATQRQATTDQQQIDKDYKQRQKVQADWEAAEIKWLRGQQRQATTEQRQADKAQREEDRRLKRDNMAVQREYETRPEVRAQHRRQEERDKALENSEYRKQYGEYDDDSVSKMSYRTLMMARRLSHHVGGLAGGLIGIFAELMYNLQRSEAEVKRKERNSQLLREARQSQLGLPLAQPRISNVQTSIPTPTTPHQLSQLSSTLSSAAPALIETAQSVEQIQSTASQSRPYPTDLSQSMRKVTEALGVGTAKDVKRANARRIKVNRSNTELPRMARGGKLRQLLQPPTTPLSKSDIFKHVADSYAVDPQLPIDLRSLYNKVKAGYPDATVSEFHKHLIEMQDSGQLNLEEVTRPEASDGLRNSEFALPRYPDVYGDPRAVFGYASPGTPSTASSGELPKMSGGGELPRMASGGKYPIAQPYAPPPSLYGPEPDLSDEFARDLAAEKAQRAEVIIGKSVAPQLSKYRKEFLGAEGDVEFRDPHFDLSNKELLEKYKSGKSVPFPKGAEGLSDEFKQQWYAISRLMPEAARSITDVVVVPPGERDNRRGAFQSGRDSAGNPVGRLHLNPDVYTINTLWHELVHAEQHLRGDLTKKKYFEPDSRDLTKHGRLMESEAYQRGAQGEETYERLGNLMMAEKDARQHAGVKERVYQRAEVPTRATGGNAAPMAIVGDLPGQSLASIKSDPHTEVIVGNQVIPHNKAVQHGLFDGKRPRYAEGGKLAGGVVLGQEGSSGLLSSQIKNDEPDPLVEIMKKLKNSIEVGTHIPGDDRFRKREAAKPQMVVNPDYPMRSPEKQVSRDREIGDRLWREAEESNRREQDAERAEEAQKQKIENRRREIAFRESRTQYETGTSPEKRSQKIPKIPISGLDDISESFGDVRRERKGFVPSELNISNEYGPPDLRSRAMRGGGGIGGIGKGGGEGGEGGLDTRIRASDSNVGDWGKNTTLSLKAPDVGSILKGAGGGDSGLSGMMGGISKAMPVAGAIMQVVEKVTAAAIGANKAIIGGIGGAATTVANADSSPSNQIAAMGNAVANAGESLSKISPVAGILVNAFGEVGKALGGFMQAMDKTVERYGEVSGPIAQQQAIGEVRQIMGDMRRAQEIGPEMIRYMQTQQDLQQKFEDLKIKVLNQILKVVTPILQIIERVLPEGEALEHAISALLAPLQMMAEAVASILNIQRDDRLPDVQDPAAILLSGVRPGRPNAVPREVGLETNVGR